jgi:hypothetical protein
MRMVGFSLDHAGRVETMLDESGLFSSSIFARSSARLETV